MKTTTILHLSICLGSSLLCVGQAPTQTKSSAPIAIVGGKPILEQEVLDSVGRELTQLRQQEYDLKSKALESLLRHALVDAEARKRGISAQELIEKEVDSKVPDPADAEVEAYFWGQNRAGVHLEDVKEQFRANLKQVRLQKARQAYADSLRPKTDVAILLRPPSIDVAWDPARVRGDVNAPVTIVEFADFQCPFCKKGEDTIKNLLAKYSGRVKWA